MNWKKIENKYPKAFKKLMIYNDIEDFYSQIENRIITASEQFERMIRQGQYPIRALYDFLDETEIYININPDFDWLYRSRPKDNDDVFFGININWEWEDDIEYKSRLEAEIAAFTKAFEILENKLK